MHFDPGGRSVAPRNFFGARHVLCRECVISVEKMGQRVRLFVDFWNFHLAWKRRAPVGASCDWQKVPLALLNAASTTLTPAGLGQLDLVETRVYASYEPGRENKLKSWLHNFLDRQPGVRVFAAERHWRERPIHCRACDLETAHCHCGAPFGRAAEKTVDARIVTDLMSLAWEESYDVALLVTMVFPVLRLTLPSTGNPSGLG